MKLTTESKILLSIAAVTLGIVGIAIVIFSRPVPTYSRAELLPETTATQGNTNAETYLVEFSDYQCPACKSFDGVVRTIIDTYGENIVFGYRHFPLDQHEYSQKAAVAAEAAGVQGKFWEMSTLLFEHQDELSDERILEFARQLELDEALFQGSRTDTTIIERIEKDKADAIRFGVNATPTFFLNGKKLSLTSQDDLIKAVEQAVGT